jgi:hypothetical protein
MANWKFKSVRWNNYKLEKYQQTRQWCLLDYKIYGGWAILFHEDIIEQHPELFEVELAEREFEHGAWYKAQYYKGQPYEIVKFHNGKFKRIGLVDRYPPLSFEEIGDKVL